MRCSLSVLSSPRECSNPAHARKRRVGDRELCSHTARTDMETRVNKGIQARAVDTRTSAHGKGVGA
jgi:hypothetical protein